jgi:hypothetical protein
MLKSVSGRLVKESPGMRYGLRSWMDRPLTLLAISFVWLANTSCSSIAPEVTKVRVTNQPEIALGEYPDVVLWGDLHVHTNLSFDSNGLGNERLGPEEAYRFAMGESVVSSSGQRAQLSRPLDFLMVADHAEYLGVLSSIRGRDPVLLATPLGQRWSGYLMSESGIASVVTDYVAMVTGQKPVDLPGEIQQRSTWDGLVDVAERYNRPGEFTTLAGYEWTSMPGGRNLHRVVVYRDGPDKTKQMLPFSALQSDDPEDLWRYMERFEKLTGGKVLAIAHNGNLSGGLMFDDVDLDGDPLSADYARRRQRWEPVYEVTQVKGDGEAHPLLSPDDRFADFETWDETDISMRPRTKNQDEARALLAGEYARSGLKKGLLYGARLGTNPYEFGLVGSTDTHTALATADDDNFWGKFLDSEPSEDRIGNRMGGNLWANARLSASGYTAVWARANTREEIFDALRRREVYATTGPRIRLRVFAGWNFTRDDLTRNDFVPFGYTTGVPMGGILPKTSGTGGPKLLIQALKDPDGAMLERVQIVKGWLDTDGILHERVHDLAEPKPDGAPYINVFWHDREFDPEQHAFYYVRVLQAPTKRWTTYDAERYGLTLPAGVPRMIQERVYGSPIWYRP